MKEFLGATLPARLEKYEALLKSKDEGKGFFLGAKVSKRMWEKNDFSSPFFSMLIMFPGSHESPVALEVS